MQVCRLRRGREEEEGRRGESRGGEREEQKRPSLRSFREGAGVQDEGEGRGERREEREGI